MSGGKSGDLLSQWWTLGTIATDRRTSGRHITVAWVIIDRYYGKYGNAQASVRFIARGARLTTTTVAKACRELVEWGYLTARTGTGQRPTEYAPNWSSVSPVSHTKIDEISVLQGSDASVAPSYDTKLDSVAPVSDESYLRNRPTGRLTVSRNEAALPSCGQEPAPAAAVKTEGFDELWAAYPRKHKRAEAKAAYDKLAPDATLHTAMVAAATALAEHYKVQRTELQYQKYPRNWIIGECYLEDLPASYSQAKGDIVARSKATARSKPAASESVEASGLSAGTPLGRHAVEIIEFETEAEGPVLSYKFRYKIDGGKQAGKMFTHKFEYLTDSGTDDDGSKFYADILAATGIEPTDTEDMRGAKLCAVVGPCGRIGYEPLTTVY